MYCKIWTNSCFRSLYWTEIIDLNILPTPSPILGRVKNSIDFLPSRFQALWFRNEATYVLRKKSFISFHFNLFIGNGDILVYVLTKLGISIFINFSIKAVYYCHRGSTNCSKIVKPSQTLPLQMAERLPRAQSDSIANHVTARSISDWRALTSLATESGWARGKRSAICSGKLISAYMIPYDVNRRYGI